MLEVPGDDYSVSSVSAIIIAMLVRVKKYRYFLIVIAVIVIVRCLVLSVSPPGFYMDEGASQANVSSFIDRQTSADGQPWPLFASNGGGGYTTPTYLYPLATWSAIFGDGRLAIRAFSEFVTILAVAVLTIALRYWLGTTLALIGAIIGLALPWGWLQGSVAWDPVLVPLFVTTGFLSFTVLLFDKRPRIKRASLVTLPISLLALAYVYPPCRVTAPLLFFGAYILLHSKAKITSRQITISCLGSTIIAVPLLLFMVGSLYRTQELMVFHDTSILSGLRQLIVNFGGLLNPVFLFIQGDHNLRHSTGQQGMLGLAAILPIACLIIFIVGRRTTLSLKSIMTRPKQLLVLVTVLAITAGLLGSALTNEGQPHSLRATAAWPFFVILITLGWSIIKDARSRWLAYVASAVLIAGTASYVVDLAVYYPARAASAFDATQHY